MARRRRAGVGLRDSAETELGRFNRRRLSKNARPHEAAELCLGRTNGSASTDRQAP